MVAVSLGYGAKTTLLGLGKDCLGLKSYCCVHYVTCAPVIVTTASRGHNNLFVQMLYTDVFSSEDALDVCLT